MTHQDDSQATAGPMERDSAWQRLLRMLRAPRPVAVVDSTTFAPADQMSGRVRVRVAADGGTQNGTQTRSPLVVNHSNGHTGAVKLRPQPLKAAHTLEMSQLGDLNRRLAGDEAKTPITAGELGLPAEVVPVSAVLVGLHWEGPTKYPYIHGRFSHEAGQRSIDLHTQTLRAISERLGLSHVWGS